ncbi:ankyrin repeat domain-containing protein [Vampirovibrio chlorellavorus]|uniref:ankyrin repeat domain-containing protein n=1 Tax=Vampirovibrio chlorellavorus TaxID=758823 RepID=UPI0026F24B0A|nr:ankyrin repeat domain-containing protein [Vampirovibrio chlorellavorus]
MFTASYSRPSASVFLDAQSRQKPVPEPGSEILFSGRTGQTNSTPESDQLILSTQSSNTAHQALFQSLWQKNYAQLGQRLAAQPELANILDPTDQTPILLAAVAAGDLEATSLLLDSGADSLRPNPQGITPIVLAVANGNVPMVRLLLEKGAPLSSYHQNMPLTHLAVHTDNVEMLKALQAAGTDVNTRDALKRTPLHIAAEQDSTEATRWLLANGAELEARDEAGYSPLHRAALQGNEAAFTVLQQAGADLNTRNALGLTPYLTAAGAGKVRLMKALQSAGADVQALTPSGLPALHWASGLNQAEVLRHLLSPKHRGDKQTGLNQSAGRQGYTPLHLAVAFQNQEAMEELLRERKKGLAPADWHHPDANGHTPRDYAEAHGAAFLAKWPALTGATLPAPDPMLPIRPSGASIPEASQGAKTIAPVPGLTAPKGKITPALSSISLRQVTDADVPEQSPGRKAGHPPKLAPQTPSGHLAKRGKGPAASKLSQSASSMVDDVSSAAAASKKAGKSKKKGKQPQSTLPQTTSGLDEIDEAVLAVYGAKPEESRETFLDILNRHSDTLRTLDEQGKYDFLTRQLNAFNINKPYQVALGSASNPSNRLPVQVTPLHVAILSTMPVKWVELFLEKGADPSIKDTVGRTPFHLAAMTGRSDYLDALNAKGKWSAQFRKPEIWKNSVGNTPLHDAAREGRVEAVQWFLNKKFPVNVKNEHEETPLHLAAKQGHAEVMACLLRHNANPEAQNGMGRTPLHLAVLADKPETLSAFLTTSKKFFPIKNSQAWKNLEGNTPLHEAARAGLLDSVEWLMAQGFSVNEPNNDLETPLHLAAAGGHTAFVLRLLEEGANPNARTKAGMSPLHSATHTLATETLEALLRSGKFDPNATLTNGSPALHLAVVNQDLDSVRLLLANGADINQTEKTGRGALQLAALMNDGPMLDELLKRGADPGRTDVEGENVLHHLLGPRKNHDATESVTILKRLFGQLPPQTVQQMLNTADRRFRNTPLHLAVATGNTEAVQFLLAHGADPTLTNCAGKNSLMAAVDNSFRASIDEIVNRLLKQPDEQVKNMLAGETTDEGANVLHLGAALNLTEAMSAILEKQNALARKGLNAGLNPNTPDMNGRTPLHYAAMLGKVEAVRFLLSENADPTPRDGEGRTPLMAALEYASQASQANPGSLQGALKISNVLTDEILAAIRNQAVDAGESPHRAVTRAVNQTNAMGYGPLHLAATEGGVELLKKMLQQGADPTLLTQQGGSPLHIATDFENAETSSQMTEALLEAYYRQGGPALVSKMVQLKDNMGVTPLFVAKVLNRPALEQRMRHYRPDASPLENAPDASASNAPNAFAKRKVIKVPFQVC